MRGVNKVILVGNLGKDPEMKYFESGVPKASFSLATSESYTSKTGERIDNTEWHNIITWRGFAEVAEKYLKKGDPVYIEGKIKNRSWDDADGNKKYITEIEVSNLVLLPKRNMANTTNATTYAGTPNTSNTPNTVTQAVQTNKSNGNEAVPPKPQFIESSPTETVQDIEDDLPF